MQMPEEELIQLKFRIYDGTDIGPFRYPPTSTVATLKDRVVSDWPKGCRFLHIFFVYLVFATLLVYANSYFLIYVNAFYQFLCTF